MSKTLIIAEKPSVAADISRALGGFTKQGDHFESDHYVLSSAVGHLVEISAPEQFEVKRGKWSFANLPVLPTHFDLNPITKSEDRLKSLTRLLKRKDVGALINACDAGREGELIFRLIVQHAKAKQPIKRLWLQSMTPAAIREAFTRLRDDVEMMPLADAARCRSEADWLVGINGTRAMTAFNSRDGGFYLTTVGRVQTPTLAVVVEREERIKRFVAREYFEVKAQFGAQAGAYEGRWFDPKFKKDENDAEVRAERLWDRGTAERIVQDCAHQDGQVSEESKPSSQMAPALFDLTSLQREANGRFGLSAKTTLSIAQALYERHKAITYPRTDSRALPEDYLATVKQTFSELQATPAFGSVAKQVLTNNWIKPNKRIFDNTKVSDHFAIIPTVQTPKTLSDLELKIYELIVRRFVAIFFPAAEYLVTTRITTVKTHQFKTEGRVLTNPGWLTVYGRAAAEETGNLVPVKPLEQVHTNSIDALVLSTKPPARYNEGTLLSAMEGAGKLIEDDELRAAMAAKGLGTPATRAAVIEGLISENYLIRDGKDLIPTTKAFQLFTLLRGLGVTELTAPELTGEWEYKLAQMERGGLKREDFMREIADIARQVVERAKNYQADTVPGDYATLATACPKCGAVVKENYRRFACTKCDFSITKIPGGRQLEVVEAEQLLLNKTLGPLQGFRSRIGRPFAALLKMTAEHKLEFDFGQNTEGEDGAGIDFTGAESLGPCPKCGHKVFEHGLSYVCEQSGAVPKACDFRSGKIILQQEISREQMTKLLDTGRTDLMPGFVSMRTRRKFKAFLVRGAEGKVSFEFEPRPERPAGKGGPAKGTAGLPATAAATGAGAGAKKAAATARKPVSEKPAAKSPAAKKPVAKKPAAKKSAARKSSSGKTVVAKKAAAKKPPSKTVAKPASKTRSR